MRVHSKANDVLIPHFSFFVSRSSFLVSPRPSSLIPRPSFLVALHPSPPLRLSPVQKLSEANMAEYERLFKTVMINDKTVTHERRMKHFDQFNLIAGERTDTRERRRAGDERRKEEKKAHYWCVCCVACVCLYAVCVLTMAV